MGDKSQIARETYRTAGVKIAAADRIEEVVKKEAGATFRPEVLANLGFSGGLFKLGDRVETKTVSSADGVGHQAEDRLRSQRA